jgi:hypothetical protein
MLLEVSVHRQPFGRLEKLIMGHIGGNQNLLLCCDMYGSYYREPWRELGL